MFKRVTIIGLGLIGGSLALAIKEKRMAKEIVGVSRRPSTIRQALALKIVDQATLNVKEGIKGSDLVILATPVIKIIDIAREISGFLKKDLLTLTFSTEERRKAEGVIITDVGSTKKKIVRTIESILPDTVNFVGSHPLAGSEKSGLTYMDKDLFKGAYCILTETKRTNPETLNKIKKFWNRLGLKVEIMSPQRHDRIISRLSHLPHAVSVALSNTCGKKDLQLAAGGFKDTTRIASGRPELWKDIFITNRKNIARDIRVLKKELSKIEIALKNNNSAQLLRLLNRAKDIRDSI